MNNLISSRLDELHITVKLTSPEEFFLSTPNLSLDHLDPAILTSPVGPSETFVQFSDSTACYLSSLDIATRPNLDNLIPSRVINLMRETLNLLDFSTRGRHLCTGSPIPGEASDSNTALPTLNLIHGTQRPLVLLLVVGENTIDRVLSEAIEAFQFNNRMRIERGLLSLEEMTIPCIGMDGTQPTFYLVPVSLVLSECAITGRRPETETVMEVCRTPADLGEGMEDMRYRKLALQCLLAFKELAKSHWDHILLGSK